eukprot:SAG31_NODE_14241_length_819_cov_0.869444_2_plen_156_part_00
MAPSRASSRATASSEMLCLPFIREETHDMVTVQRGRSLAFGRAVCHMAVCQIHHKNNSSERQIVLRKAAKRRCSLHTSEKQGVNMTHIKNHGIAGINSIRNMVGHRRMRQLALRHSLVITAGHRDFQCNIRCIAQQVRTCGQREASVILHRKRSQ